MNNIKNRIFHFIILLHSYGINIFCFLPYERRDKIARRWLMGRAIRHSNLYTGSRKLKFGKNAKLGNLMPGDFISSSVALTGWYELFLTRQLSTLGSTKGGLLVDVGANLGYFSILWASLLPTNRVIAIEASPNNIPKLLANIELNNMQRSIFVIDAAAGDETAMVSFDLGDTDQTGWGGITRDRTSAISVQMRRLDDILHEEPFIEVLKVDVEGADYLVIKGCTDILKQKRIGKIFFEENIPRMAALGIAPGEIQALLSELGYKCEKLGDTADEWIATAIV